MTRRYTNRHFTLLVGRREGHGVCNKTSSSRGRETARRRYVRANEYTGDGVYVAVMT